MVNLFGNKYSKEELLKKIGDISQIGGVRLVELGDGYERGVRAAEFRTGSGLDYTVVIDRGLDISAAAFKGQPLAWRSAMTDKAPAYYDDKGLGWLRSFPGGLVVTCGLTYVGAPCDDGDQSLGLHGRISNTPATNVYADGAWLEDGSYEMWIQGKLKESVVFGENIQMERKISSKLGENVIRIHDKVTNLGYYESEHMLLYHINAGFPVVDTESKLVAPVKSYKPRDEKAEVGKEKYAELEAPVHSTQEKVYYLDLAEDVEGNTAVALINKSVDNGFGFYVKFPKKELPKFIEWRNPSERDYVVGLEPANCYVEGRDVDRKNGVLQFLQPGETREYHVEIGILSSPEEIESFEKYVKSLI